MSSTFMGLETSKRGLTTQQSALYTVGHNISNANTDGYSRQRVNMETTPGFPGVGMNAPKVPGFLGTGVQVGSVQRIRDKFVDTQYRQENNKLGYWQSKSETISKVEDILNEPSDSGLAQTLNEFWNSLQDLNVNPEDGGARAVVAQRGVAVADSFNYMSKSLSQVQANVGSEIGISLKDINSTLEQIANLNKQIKDVEPNGYLPNDLYDARDTLIDKLSTYFPVDLQYTPSGGNATKLAEGAVTISIKLNDGSKLKLVDGQNFAQLRTDGATDGVTPTTAMTGLYLVKQVKNADGTVTDSYLNKDWTTEGTKEVQNINNFSNVGKVKSLVDSYGYSTDGTSTGTIAGVLPDMLANLNKLAKSFANEFNTIHNSGSDLNGNAGQDFFVKNNTTDSEITSANISVSQTIVDDPNKIAASDSVATSPANPEPGNGKLALQLSNMKFTSLSDLGGVSAQTYFEGLIGQLGVDGQQASRLQTNSETLLQSVTERRSSVSSVSLDEEMTNMISFQKAYNANARMITAIDETLDKIINGMGRVGL